MSAELQQALLGIGTGAIYALLALGLQVTYRGSGILNFGHGALAMLGAFVHLELHDFQDWPFFPSALVAVFTSAAVGFLFSIFVMRRLKDASPLSRTVATLGLLLVLVGIATARWGGQGYGAISSPLPNRFLRFGDYGVGEDRLWMLGIAASLCVGLWALFRFTTYGLATMAAAENERAAATVGWSGDQLAAASWALGGGLAAVAGVLVVPVTGLQVTTTTMLIIPALAVCVVGGFRSFGIAVVVGIVLGSSTAAIQLHVSPGAAKSLPFALIVVALVATGRSLPLRSFVLDRPPALGTGRISARAVAFVVVVTVAVLALLANDTWLDAFSVSFGVGVVLLSIVILTGYTGQLSLTQYTIGGLGALLAAQLIVRWGWPFEFAVLAAVALAVPIGLIFAVPALRTRGVNLAIVTLGMAVAAYDVIFSDGDLTGGFAGLNVGPQTIFGISIDPLRSPLSYCLFALAMLVVCMLMTANLRRSSLGRRLIAVRTNERAAAALGISVVGAKLYAFGLAAGVAALGGIVLAFRYPSITFDDYDPYRSIQVVAYAAIGGVGYAIGPLLGFGFFAGSIGSTISVWLGEHSWLPRALVVVLGLVTLVRTVRVQRRRHSGARAALAVGRVVAVYAGLFWLVRWIFEKPDERLTLGAGLVLLAMLVRDPDGLAAGHVHAWHAITARLRRRAVAADPKDKSRPDVQVAAAQDLDVRRAALEVRGLSVRFGGVTAVEDLDLRVEPGTIVGLIGPNGAGKTTVIDAITGFVSPSSGVITLDGRELQSMSAVQRARIGLSRSFQSLELFEDLTVGENLLAAGHQVRPADYVTSLVGFGRNTLSGSASTAIGHFRLNHVLGTRVDELPYGERRLAAIARAVAVTPSVLLLDEPAAGLGPTASAELAVLVKDLARNSGMGVLLVEHDMDFVMNVCDRIVVLNFGRRIAEGVPAEVRADQAVVEAYLGVSVSATEPHDDANRTPASSPG